MPEVVRNNEKIGRETLRKVGKIADFSFLLTFLRVRVNIYTFIKVIYD